MRIRPERLARRAAAAAASEKTAVIVRADCDRCGALPALSGHTASMDHVTAYPAHTVTLQVLNTTVYRHPNRVRKES